MPRLTKSDPRYRLHKQSGRGRVRIDGRDILLPGKYRSAESRAAYDRIVGEWRAHGRSLPTEPDQPITVSEVMAAYVRFAKTYYMKNGKTTVEYNLIVSALSHLRRLYGSLPAIEFGPQRLKVVRDSMIKEDWCRVSINRQISRIRRVFKWATGEEMIPVAVHQALQTLSDLKRGRSEARESTGVAPVAETTIQQTLPHLPAVVADMVRFQRLTGCRPGEVCSMTPACVNRTEDVWLYRPTSHKTEHHDRERVIFIGPKAQLILQPYLLRGGDDCCFSPKDSEKKRRKEQHANRKTPLSCGNRPGSNRKRRPRRPPGTYYTVSSYRRCIQRAVEKANEQMKEGEEPLAIWAPNQLRHTAATEIRKEFGIEGSQVVLGHANMKTTEVYAERDMELGIRIAQQVG